jgi:hypothetical protein
MDTTGRIPKFLDISVRHVGRQLANEPYPMLISRLEHNNVYATESEVLFLFLEMSKTDDELRTEAAEHAKLKPADIGYGEKLSPTKPMFVWVETEDEFIAFTLSSVWYQCFALKIWKAQLPF